MPKQAKPTILGTIGKLLTRLATVISEPKHVLKMMNHFVDKDRLFSRRAAIPILGKIDRLGGVVINGDSVVVSSCLLVVLCRSAWRDDGIVAQGNNFFGRHQFYDGLMLYSW